MEAEGSVNFDGTGAIQAVYNCGKDALAIGRAVEEAITRICEAVSSDGSIIRAAKRPANTSAAIAVGHIPRPQDNLPYIEVAVHATGSSSQDADRVDKPTSAYEERIRA